ASWACSSCTSRAWWSWTSRATSPTSPSPGWATPAPPSNAWRSRSTRVDGVPGLMAAEELRAIEAILMVAEDPVEPGLLAQLLEVSAERVEQMCAALAEAYETE